MLTFATENLTERLPELKEFFPAHYRELALNQDCVPLDPQYEVYLERDARGEVLFIAARSSGQIVGYFVGFVAPGLHYRTCLTLTMDIFWIHPDHRGNRGGLRLFNAVEEEAKRRGVKRIFLGSKMHKDVGWLFEKLGYMEVERYYSKVF